MKFLLKSFLLFLLILAGKAVKQQNTLTGSIANKQAPEPAAALKPKQVTSFFTRQISAAPTQTTSQPLWRTTAARTEPVNFE